MNKILIRNADKYEYVSFRRFLTEHIHGDDYILDSEQDARKISDELYNLVRNFIYCGIENSKIKIISTDEKQQIPDIYIIDHEKFTEEFNNSKEHFYNHVNSKYYKNTEEEIHTKSMLILEIPFEKYNINIQLRMKACINKNDKKNNIFWRNGYIIIKDKKNPKFGWFHTILWM